tara:strand:+ start:13133 stop:13267 length:135 start_codon:yes stop_codon:yes gene_type:complete
MFKKFKEGDLFPKDFWNYNINPILGYKYVKKNRNVNNEEKKYSR